MTQEKESQLWQLGAMHLKRMQELVKEVTIPLTYPTWVELSQKSDGGLSVILCDEFNHEKPGGLVGNVLIKGDFVC